MATWAAFRLPVVELAKKHADEVHPREARGGALKPLRVWHTGAPTLMRFGLGVGLYFEFLKAMAFVFAAMSVFTVPALYFNLSGSRIRSNSDRIPIPATTVGNLGERHATTFADYSVSLYGFSAGITAKTAGLAMSCLDVGYSLVFLAALAILRWRQGRAAREAAAEQASCADYAVQVWGLPGDAREEELAAHLAAAYGQVEEVALARNDAVLLSLYRARAGRAERVERERVLAARAEKEAAAAAADGAAPAAPAPSRALARAVGRLEEVDRAIAARRARPQSARVVCAFVIFREKAAAERAAAEGRRGPSRLRRALCGCCGPSEDPSWQVAAPGPVPPAQLTLAAQVPGETPPSDGAGAGAVGHLLGEPAGAPPPPSALGRRPAPPHERRQVGPVSRFLRLLLLVAAALALMVATAAAVYGAQGQAASVFPTESRCRLLYPALEDVADAATGALTNPNCAVRFCKAPAPRPAPRAPAARSPQPPHGHAGAPPQGLSQELRLFHVAVCRNEYCEELDPGEVVREPRCAPFLQDLAKLTGLQAAVVLVVTAVNLLTVRAVKRLTSFGRFHTATGRSLQSLWLLTVAQFVNTALIALAVNARLAGPGAEAAGVPLFFGVYDDFESAWYRTVGASIVVALATSALSSGLLPSPSSPSRPSAAGAPAARPPRRGAAPAPPAAGAGAAGRQGRRDLDRAYEGRTFDVPSQLASALALLFTCLLYSAGMPILVPLAAALFTVTYWCEKVAFCRLYLKPPAFSIALARRAIGLAQGALLLHLAFACWIYSSPDIFPSEEIGVEVAGAAGAALYESYLGGGGALNAGQRLRRVSAAPVLALLLVLAALELPRRLAPLLPPRLRTRLRPRAPSVSAADEAAKPAPFGAARAGMEACGPATYDIRASPRFRGAFESLARDGHLPALAAAPTPPRLAPRPRRPSPAPPAPSQPRRRPSSGDPAGAPPPRSAGPPRKLSDAASPGDVSLAEEGPLWPPEGEAEGGRPPPRAASSRRGPGRASEGGEAAAPGPLLLEDFEAAAEAEVEGEAAAPRRPASLGPRPEGPGPGPGGPPA
eukprot:tig00000802_g4268.t1